MFTDTTIYRSLTIQLETFMPYYKNMDKDYKMTVGKHIVECICDGCSGLTSITVEATEPPKLGTNAFNNTNDCPIYVPAESVDTYKAASVWSGLASRIQAIPSE